MNQQAKRKLEAKPLSVRKHNRPVSIAIALALFCSAISVADVFEDAGIGTLLQLPALLVPLVVGIAIAGPRFLESPVWRRSPMSGLLTFLFLASATVSAALAAATYFDPYPLLFDACIVLGFIVWGGVWVLEEEVIWSAARIYCCISSAAIVATWIALRRPDERFAAFFHPNMWGLLCFTSFCLAGLIRKRGLRALIMAGNVIVILAAQSRSALVATLTAAVVMGYFWARSARMRKEDKLLLFIAGSCAIAVAAFVFRAQEALLFTEAFRLDDRYRGLGTGFSGRADLWQDGLRIFEMNPLFGVGPRMEARHLSGGMPYSHSGYISTLAQFGVIGSTLFFGFVFLRTGRLWRMAVQKRQGATVGAAFVMGYLAQAVFDPKFLSVGNPASLLLLGFLLLPEMRTRIRVRASRERIEQKPGFAGSRIPAAYARETLRHAGLPFEASL